MSNETTVSNKTILEMEREEGIKTSRKDGVQTKTIGITLSMEHYEDLLKIQKWYRSPSITHTFRLLIPDVAKGIEQDAPLSRIANNS